MTIDHVEPFVPGRRPAALWYHDGARSVLEITTYDYEATTRGPGASSTENDR